MRRVSKVSNSIEYESNKSNLYNDISDVLEAIAASPTGSEDRIMMDPAKCKLPVFITGKPDEVRAFAKTLLGYAERAGVRTCVRMDPRPNCYGALIFDCTDNRKTGSVCTSDQREEMRETWERHKGLSIVALQYSNFSDNVITAYGDGYYVQLGNPVRKSKVEGF